jgi:hypothetical protein
MYRLAYIAALLAPLVAAAQTTQPAFEEHKLGAVINASHVGWTITPEGSHLWWAADNGNSTTIVRDGQPGPTCESLTSLKCSPDGMRCAFAFAADGNTFVNVDGRVGDKYDRITHPLAFSPNSQHLVYVTLEAGKEHAYIDGKCGQACSDTSPTTAATRFAATARILFLPTPARGRGWISSSRTFGASSGGRATPLLNVRHQNR